MPSHQDTVPLRGEGMQPTTCTVQDAPEYLGKRFSQNLSMQYEIMYLSLHPSILTWLPAAVKHFVLIAEQGTSRSSGHGTAVMEPTRLQDIPSGNWHAGQDFLDTCVTFISPTACM